MTTVVIPWKSGQVVRDMRQRIRKIKDKLYPMFIYAARRRKAWEQARSAGVRFSEAMREAYARAREEQK